MRDKIGRFGQYGGQYVPETLMTAVNEVTEAYEHYKNDPEFVKELDDLMRNYAGRPSLLYYAEKMTKDLGGAKIYLKREDLNHTGSHKINNVLGQVLLAKKMGKKRVIAETGAGQHGVATATAAALMDMECEIFMGKEDTDRQALNVFRMELLGAKVHAVTSGTMTLKDAVNETMREWASRMDDSMVALGSTPKEALDALAPRSRDNARTPYQWDATENAGFTTGKPWLKVNPKYPEINLAEDRESEDSIFAFYQELTKMRREEPAIIDGDLQFLLEDHEDLIVYLRRCARQTLLIVANKSGNTVPFPMPEELKGNLWERKLTNLANTQPTLETGRSLLPWELEIYELAR